MLENVEGAFVCSDCTFFDGNTGCGQGVCNHTNKECNCVNGYSGGRCQAPPVEITASVIYRDIDVYETTCVSCEPKDLYLDQSENSVQVFNVNLTLDYNRDMLYVAPVGMRGEDQEISLSVGGILLSKIE